MNAINEINAPTNWEFTSHKEKLFSSDHVIDAYLKGKNESLEEAQKLVLEKLVKNINKAGKHTKQVLHHFNKNNLNPISAFLKINSWDDFTIMVVLPHDEFLSKKIISVYEFVSEFENKVSEDLYHIQITICDSDGNLDENYIRSDGFVLKHKSSK
ncbi:MAG: hypothetical protein WD048_01420 [Chitinophagales bacterium]